MQFLVAIFCFIIFFYSLYILGKDDFVLIRRNISLEQLFDFAFLGIIAGILFIWILSLIFHTPASFISGMLSPQSAGFTLIGICFGLLLGLYSFTKYRKLPIGRLFDFFSLSLLSALPAGYLLSIFFIKSSEIIFYLIPGVLYLGLQVFFWRFFLSRIISGKLREGSLCSLFLLTSSVISLFISLLYKFLHSSLYLTSGDFLLFSILIVSFIFLLRNERVSLRGAKRQSNPVWHSK